jgi:uncharacterized protein YprB with RNaseH-like and TPR domain
MDVICAAWKWEGEDEVHAEKTYTTNDKRVVSKLRKAVCEADELVYHNGKKFDFKKLNTRVLMNNLKPMPKPRETDTLIQVKKHFGFTSNRLDYLGKVLVEDQKMDTGGGLWMKALQKDREAIDKMLEYNIQDVLLLEKVFNKLRPHIELGVNENTNKLLGQACPDCSSSNLQSRGYTRTKTGKYRRFQCQDCGKWCSSGTREKQEGIVYR